MRCPPPLDTRGSMICPPADVIHPYAAQSRRADDSKKQRVAYGLAQLLLELGWYRAPELWYFEIVSYKGLYLNNSTVSPGSPRGLLFKRQEHGEQKCLWIAVGEAKHLLLWKTARWFLKKTRSTIRPDILSICWYLTNWKQELKHSDTHSCSN